MSIKLSVSSIKINILDKYLLEEVKMSPIIRFRFRYKGCVHIICVYQCKSGYKCLSYRYV